MSDAVQDAVDEIMADLRALTGIAGAPDEPPNKIAQYPFIIGFVSDGEWRSDIPGNMIGLLTVTVELHLARTDLARNINEAMGYCVAVPNALLKPVATSDGDSFNHKIETLDRIPFTFGPMEWAGVQTIGFRWRVQGVKVQMALV